MNILRTLLVAAFLQVATQPAAQQNVPAGSIEGTAVRAASGEPLSHAQLKLAKVRTPDEEREAYRDGNDPDANAPTAITEADGKFVLKNIPAGPYYLSATHNGYAPQRFGQKVRNGPASIINVQAGQIVENLTFCMIQGGVVTGRVRTTTGEPIVGLTVVLMRMSYTETGARSLSGEEQVLTDDRGEYRFYWIQPGRYYLRVSRGGDFFPARKAVLDDEPVLPTFYPGVLDPESAPVIEVQAGRELSAVDVVVPRQQTYKLRGRIVDSSTGKPPKNASVSITPRRLAAIRVYDYYFSRSQNYDPASGNFEIRNILPGTYWLNVSGQAGYNDPIAAEKLANVKTQEDLFEAAFGNSGVAQVAIDVSASDLNDVVVTLKKGVTIPVQFNIEGQQFSTVKGADEMRLSLEPVAQIDSWQGTNRVNADGVARLENTQEGEYRVYVDQGTAKDLYVREVVYGRTDVLYENLVISDEVPSALTVTLSSKGGQIEGNLTDAFSQPANGAEVVLIPDQRDRKRLFKRVNTDHNGHFVFRAVPPGGYKVFAWEAIEPRAYYDPEILSRYETQGRPVRVQESAKETIDLKVIPAPK